MATTYFKIPKLTQLKYPIEVRYVPSVPDNVKHWRVFHDDKEIKKFLELTCEFSTSLIYQDQYVELDESASCTKNSIGSENIFE